MRAALACALLVVSADAAASGGVAFVADLKGSITIEGDGPLVFLAELAPGTRLLAGTHATAIITYAASGSEFGVAGPGEFLVTPSEVKAEKGAEPKRRRVAALPDPVMVTRISQVATASLRMRGVGAPPRHALLEYPVDSRIATLRPAIRFAPAAPKDASLVLEDAEGREVWKGRPSGARLPVALAPAASYRLLATASDGRQDEARFETLPADAIARIEKARAAGKGFPERVLHAMLLQDAGAEQDARIEWAALAKLRPDLPQLEALAR